MCCTDIVVGSRGEVEIDVDGMMMGLSEILTSRKPSAKSETAKNTWNSFSYPPTVN